MNWDSVRVERFTWISVIKYDCYTIVCTVGREVEMTFLWVVREFLMMFVDSCVYEKAEGCEWGWGRRYQETWWIDFIQGHLRRHLVELLASWSKVRRSAVWMLLPSKSWRPRVRLPAGSMSTDWSGAKSSSSAADPTWPARWWKRIASRSKSFEMAQENTPLSLASMESWWSKLLSASRIARPRSRCAAAIACDRLFPTFCNWESKSIGNVFNLKYLFFLLHNSGCLPPPKRALGLICRYVDVGFYRESDWTLDSFPKGSPR